MTVPAPEGAGVDRCRTLVLGSAGALADLAPPPPFVTLLPAYDATERQHVVCWARALIEAIDYFLHAAAAGEANLLGLIESHPELMALLQKQVRHE